MSRLLLLDASVFIDTFDPASENHRSSVDLLQNLRRRAQLVSMPAHGWFEVQCTLRRLRSEGRFVGPIFDGRMEYELRLIHLDEPFIQKYAPIEIPHLKAGDHIYVVVAKANDATLVTNDKKMRAVAIEVGVHALSSADLNSTLEIVV